MRLFVPKCTKACIAIWWIVDNFSIIPTTFTVKFATQVNITKQMHLNAAWSSLVVLLLILLFYLCFGTLERVHLCLSEDKHKFIISYHR